MSAIVSVVIAAYNAAPYIGATLDSILAQTFTEWECWVVDDGSTDETVSIVEKYSIEDARFKIIKTSGGNGPYASANLAFPKCAGEFIARLDADDLALPQRFMSQITLLRQNGSLNVCGTYYYNLYDNGSEKLQEFETSPVFLKWQLLYRNRLVHSTMMLRKTWFESKGYYPSLRLAQDWLIWVTAASEDCLAIIREPLGKWRLHDNSITKKESGEQLRLAGDVSIKGIRSITGCETSVENVIPVVSAIRGKGVADADIGNCVEELIRIYKSFVERYQLSGTDCKLIKNEFQHFAFSLIIVNRWHVSNMKTLVWMLCRTAFNLRTVRWLLVYLKASLVS